MRIQDMSPALAQDADGIYRSDSAQPISYARDGHDACFQVEDRSFWFKHRNDCIAAMVANHPFRGALLDIGGGNGFVAKRLATEGWEVVLLEPGAVGAHNARLNRGLKHVVCATIESAGFRPRTFGAIGMFDVIEHVEHDRDFLERAAELLAEGGRLYMTVPCHQWLWSQADVRAGHYRRHARASVERLMGGLFRLDYFTYFFAPLVLPQLFLRAIPSRIGLTRGDGVLTTEAEHGSDNGFATRMLSSLLHREWRRVARGETIRFGSSCLVAATRL